MINSPSFVGYTRLGAETTAAKTDWREVRTLNPNFPNEGLIAAAIRFRDPGNEDVDRGQGHLVAVGGEQPGTIG